MAEDGYSSTKGLILAPKEVHCDGIFIKIEKAESLEDLADSQNIVQNNHTEFQANFDAGHHQKSEFIRTKEEAILDCDGSKHSMYTNVNSLKQADDSVLGSTSKLNNTHTNGEPSKKSFKCSVCDKRYSTLSNMHTHLRKHHLKLETKIHKCQLCDSAFEKVCRLKDHVRRHMGLGYECLVCKTKLATAASLKRHVKILHQSALSYKCNPCNLKFATPSGLEAHDRHHHSAMALTICPVCEKGFKTCQGLKKHMSTHPHVDPAASLPQTVVHEDMQVFTISELGAEQQKPEVALTATLVDPYSNITIDQQIIEPEGRQKFYALDKHEDAAISDQNSNGKQYVFYEDSSYENIIKQEDESDNDGVEFLSDKEESTLQTSNKGENKHISIAQDQTGILKSALDFQTADEEGAVGFNCAACKNSGVYSKTLTKLDDVLRHIRSHNDICKNHCTSCGKTFRYNSHLRVHINRLHLKTHG